ncbi:hypothetical protein KSP39_PZI006306 [Platanthera zijinensis]|uniref:Retrotransposon gag domain-containing protein n=1 Tax=Platanthera zijinensis TaxID=2320716 RepID=A0AAP0BRS5_9ASPA
MYHRYSEPTYSRSHRVTSERSSHYYDDHSRSQYTTFRDRVDPPTRPHYARDDQYDYCHRAYPYTRVDHVDPSTRLGYLRNDYYEDSRSERDLESKFRTASPSFDGSSSPESFSYWLVDMEHYLDHFELFGERRVKFAKLRLLDQARAYWACVERTRERDRLRRITNWADMKRILCQRYLPSSYRSRLLDQLFFFQQGSMSVAKYKDCFDVLVVRSDIREDPAMTTTRFRSGLQSDIRTKVVYHSSESLEQTYQLALRYERSLRSARAGRWDSHLDLRSTSPSHVEFTMTPTTILSATTEVMHEADCSHPSEVLSPVSDLSLVSDPSPTTPIESEPERPIESAVLCTSPTPLLLSCTRLVNTLTVDPILDTTPTDPILDTTPTDPFLSVGLCCSPVVIALSHITTESPELDVDLAVTMSPIHGDTTPYDGTHMEDHDPSDEFYDDPPVKPPDEPPHPGEDTNRVLHEGEQVMVRICVVRLRARLAKSLSVRRMGPYSVLRRIGTNAYELDIPASMGTHTVFNVEDLMPNFAPHEYSSPHLGVPPEPLPPFLPPTTQSTPEPLPPHSLPRAQPISDPHLPGILSPTVPPLAPQIPPDPSITMLRDEIITEIFTHESVPSTDGLVCRYLVYGRGRSFIDDTWMLPAELDRLALDFDFSTTVSIHWRWKLFSPEELIGDDTFPATTLGRPLVDLFELYLACSERILILIHREMNSFKPGRVMRSRDEDELWAHSGLIWRLTIYGVPGSTIRLRGCVRIRGCRHGSLLNVWGVFFLHSGDLLRGADSVEPPCHRSPSKSSSIAPIQPTKQPAPSRAAGPPSRSLSSSLSSLLHPLQPPNSATPLSLCRTPSHPRPLYLRPTAAWLFSAPNQSRSGHSSPDPTIPPFPFAALTPPSPEPFSKPSNVQISFIGSSPIIRIVFCIGFLVVNIIMVQLQAFINGGSEQEVLQLYVENCFHRLLLHGVCEYYNLISSTVKTSEDSESSRMTRIKKKTSSEQALPVPAISLSQFLKMARDGLL